MWQMPIRMHIIESSWRGWRAVCNTCIPSAAAIMKRILRAFTILISLMHLAFFGGSHLICGAFITCRIRSSIQTYPMSRGDCTQVKLLNEKCQPTSKHCCQSALFAKRNAWHHYVFSWKICAENLLFIKVVSCCGAVGFFLCPNSTQ